MMKTFQITLQKNELGQMIDGLEVRAKAWRNTERYLRTNELPEEGFVCEECNDADEADRLATAYEKIIDKIIRQRNQQSS